jgi:hypothetical protein
VLEAMTEHIDLLTGVGADTRSHCYGQRESRIARVIGAYPVSALAYRHPAGWVRVMTEKGNGYSTPFGARHAPWTTSSNLRTLTALGAAAVR